MLTKKRFNTVLPVLDVMPPFTTKHLSLTGQPDLKFHQHITDKTIKATRSLGAIKLKCNFHELPTNSRLLAGIPVRVT